MYNNTHTQAINKTTLSLLLLFLTEYSAFNFSFSLNNFSTLGVLGRQHLEGCSTHPVALNRAKCLVEDVRKISQ